MATPLAAQKMMPTESCNVNGMQQGQCHNENMASTHINILNTTAPPSAAQKMIQRAQMITQCQHNVTRMVMTHDIVTIHTSLCASSGKPAQWSSSFHCLITNPGGHLATPSFLGSYSSSHHHQHHPPHDTPSHIYITYFTFNITD